MEKKIYGSHNLNFYVTCWGEVKSPQPFPLKTDAPFHANFRRIKQGGYPQKLVYVKISAEYLC